MNTFTQQFEGFGYEASELSAYIFCIDTFVISLKNEEIVRFETREPEVFKEWLDAHGVRNVNDSIGKMVYNHYFKKRK